MAVARQPDTRELWRERLKQAALKSDESQWDIGDLIIEAESTWGDMYTDATRTTQAGEDILELRLRVQGA